MATSTPSEGSGNLLNGQTLLDGFGFLEGQLIGNAPLVFPGEQALFMILELTAEFGGYIPVIGQLLALIAEVIIIILQLVDELVALFTGVPRAQKTGIVAHRFATGHSPISQLVSAQIYQLLNYEGKVLSSSLPADQATFGEIRTQAETMLQTLGATQREAKHAIDEVWNNTTSGTEQVPALLDQFLPQGWVLVGNKIIQQMYIDHYNQLVSQGADPKTAAKKATQYVLHHAPQKQLQKIRLYPQPGFNPCPPGQFWNPVTNTCVPATPPPPQCPPGEHWDALQRMCVPDVTTPTCPAGQVWDPVSQTCIPITTTQPGACVPVNDGTGDTLSDGLGCVSQNLNVIQNQLAALQQSIMGPGGSQLDPVTCTQLGGYVSTLNVTLTAISAAIAKATVTITNNVTVDVTPIAAALAPLLTALEKLLTGQPVDLTTLNLNAAQEIAARALAVTNATLVKAQIVADLGAVLQGLT